MGLFNWKNGQDGKTPINATNLNLAQQQLVDTIYPVGSVYISVNATDPKNLFGGTWERIKDTFLLGAGDWFGAGTTGGEAYHTLTIEEIPSHAHMLDSWYNSEAGAYFNAGVNNSGVQTENAIPTNYVGGGQPHNNMPPYLVVYMWKRIA